MSTNTVRPSAGEPMTTGLVAMTAANVVTGAPAYFVAFLFAYGFRDTVGVAEHTAFLVMVGVFALLTGLVGAVADASSTTRRFARSVAVFVPASLTLNTMVLALGSVVSAMPKDEGSVSATFSTTTDVLVAATLLLAALGLAVVARQAARPALSRRG